jgi:ABC-2 type transport system ATP-binding protein
MIELQQLTKRYGKFTAVDNIDLVVPSGELFGFLGPNGAGKTTTVEILEGYRRRSGGEVRVLGRDPESRDRSLQERVGIVLQSSGFYPRATVREAVEHFAKAYSRPRDPAETIALVGLDEKADARTKDLSGGQRRRLDLALALVGRPDVLFLDEPTTGLDPVARREAWQLVHELRSDGAAVLLTTHYMDEAEQLADRVIVMAQGKLVAEGTTGQLADRLGARAVISFRMPSGTAPRELPPVSGQVESLEPVVEVRTARPTEDLQILTSWALARGSHLAALAVTRPRLEDVYFELAVTPENQHG